MLSYQFFTVVAMRKREEEKKMPIGNFNLLIQHRNSHEWQWTMKSVLFSNLHVDPQSKGTAIPFIIELKWSRLGKQKCWNRKKREWKELLNIEQHGIHLYNVKSIASVFSSIFAKDNEKEKQIDETKFKQFFECYKDLMGLIQRII